jgi:uncharacterized protein DUF4261
LSNTGLSNMADATSAPSDKPKQLIATLLLERPAAPDYRLLAERIGKPLDFNLEMASTHKPDFPMLLAADGDMIVGIRVDSPFSWPLEPMAQFAYWWPDAMKDIARSTSFAAITCSWCRQSRLDAHIRHLVLVRELVDQLPVIGIVWGSVLIQPSVLKAEFNRLQQSELPFSVWVLIQFSKQPNGNILISTIGMRDFGQMEIETESTLPLDQTFDLVRKFGSYIIAKGPVVKDGDTMGLTETQRIKVRFVRSFRPDVNDNVYWLELAEQQSVQRPTGFFSKLFGSDRKQ